MSDLRELYQEVILDHNKNPRNAREIEGANHVCNGQNPLCGDKLRVYLDVDGDVIQDIGFEGEGCAISTASARTASVSPHFAGPNSVRKRDCAFSQSGMPSVKAWIPSSVSRKIRFRLPFGELDSRSPVFCRTAKFRVSVDRSMTNSSANAWRLTGCCRCTVGSVTNCVERSPVGCKLSSNSLVTAREALRRLKQTQVRAASAHRALSGGVIVSGMHP